MADFIEIRHKKTGEIGYAPIGTPYPRDEYVEVSRGATQPPAGALGSPERPLEAPVEEPGFIGSLLNPADLLVSLFTGGVGAGVGKTIGRGAELAARTRIGSAGRVGDIRRAAGAVRGVGTELQPGPSMESLAEATIGKGGAAALSGARERAEQDLLSLTPRPRRLTELLTELKEAGARAFSQKGELRGGVTVPTALRERADILRDIEGELGNVPGALDAFREMQRRFAQGSEMRRLFKTPGVFGGPGGFSQQPLQAGLLKRAERAGAFPGAAEPLLPRKFTETILRGGTPRTDAEVGLPFISVRSGGARVGASLPLGRLLSAPATPLGRALTGQEMQFLLQMLGAAGGGAVGPGLSQALRGRQ